MKKIFFLFSLLFLFSANAQTKIPANGFYCEMYAGTETPHYTAWYKNKLLNGTKVEYSESGTKISVYNYKDGLKNGTFSIFDKMGNLKEEGLYENDALSGIKYAYSNKKITERTIYLDKKENLIKSQSFYFGTDTVKSEIFYRNEKKDSTWKQFYPSGEIKQIKSYKDDKVYLIRDFKQNGNFEYTEYKNDKMNGLRFTLSSTGDTLSKIYYKNHLKNGSSFLVEKKDLHSAGLYEDVLIKISGNYSDDKKEGEFTWTYPNGKIARRENFLSGKQDGAAIFYDSLGNKLSQSYFTNGKATGNWMEWFASGKKKKETHYENGKRTGKTVEYYENGKIKEEMNSANNKMEYHNMYYENGKPKLKYIFKNGVTEEITYDEKGKSTKRSIIVDEPVSIVGKDTSASDNEVFMVVEEMPQFPGGDGAMYKFVGSNIKYPEMEKENGVQGKCYLSFVVNKEGEVEDVTIMKGVNGGPGCDKEAVRVVKMFPKFTPGKHNGRAVKVKMTLPISFKLQ